MHRRNARRKTFGSIVVLNVSDKKKYWGKIFLGMLMVGLVGIPLLAVLPILVWMILGALLSGSEMGAAFAGGFFVIILIGSFVGAAFPGFIVSVCLTIVGYILLKQNIFFVKFRNYLILLGALSGIVFVSTFIPKPFDLYAWPWFADGIFTGGLAGYVLGRIIYEPLCILVEDKKINLIK